MASDDVKWIFIFLGFWIVDPQTPSEKDYLIGRFDPSADRRFVKLDSSLARGSAKGAYLREETWKAFVAMSRAAQQENIHLFIISATRNFESQKRIWENKWNGKVLVEGRDLTQLKNGAERCRLIMHYSSMPGTSRHHWGTDVDLNSLDNSYFDKGEGQRIYHWLQAHAAEFGFCQPYTSKVDGRTGYEEERWHWSYTPLANELLTKYKAAIAYSDITGFAGSEFAKEVSSIEQYVSGVACHP